MPFWLSVSVRSKIFQVADAQEASQNPRIATISTLVRAKSRMPKFPARRATLTIFLGFIISRFRSCQFKPTFASVLPCRKPISAKTGSTADYQPPCRRLSLSPLSLSALQLVVFVGATIIFGTTVRVTLADLIIEPNLPADERTAAFMIRYWRSVD